MVLVTDTSDQPSSFQQPDPPSSSASPRHFRIPLHQPNSDNSVNLVTPFNSDSHGSTLLYRMCHSDASDAESPAFSPVVGYEAAHEHDVTPTPGSRDEVPVAPPVSTADPSPASAFMDAMYEETDDPQLIQLHQQFKLQQLQQLQNQILQQQVSGRCDVLICLGALSDPSRF